MFVKIRTKKIVSKHVTRVVATCFVFGRLMSPPHEIYARNQVKICSQCGFVTMWIPRMRTSYANPYQANLKEKRGHITWLIIRCLFFTLMLATLLRQASRDVGDDR